MTDWELIRQFRDRRSQAAFAELFERHMKLVYWTCRRETGDDSLAEDATQAVFVLFAQKAPTLKPGVCVSGWLFHAARFVARGVVRSERRRQRHEEAAAMIESQSEQADYWREVEPVLNDALAALSTADRNAVLLRFFDGLSLREVAGEIGTTEDTAGKRISRAIERMRNYLAKREIALAGVALGALLAERSAQAVPPAFHATALAGLPSWLSTPPEASAAALSWKQGVYLVMEATKQKTIAAIVGVVVLGALLALPIAGWRIYHQRALVAEVGHGGFTDQTATAAGIAPGESAADAHAAIATGNQQMANEFNDAHSVIGWQAYLAPGAYIADSTGRQLRTAPQAIAGNQHLLSEQPVAKVYATLQSMSVQDDTAVAVVPSRVEAVAGNRLLTVEETDEQDWKKVGDRWLIWRIMVLNHAQRLQ